jgi:preprotein translocase subunit YajC
MSPHLLLASLSAHLVLAAGKSNSKPSGSASPLIFIVIIAAIGYFLLIRPQRQKARRARQEQQAVEVGDEIMLTSGIIGRITSIEGDRARVEIAPGTEIDVVRAAISRKTPEAEAPDAAETPEPEDGPTDFDPGSWPVRATTTDEGAADGATVPGKAAPDGATVPGKASAGGAAE